MGIIDKIKESMSKMEERSRERDKETLRRLTQQEADITVKEQIAAKRRSIARKKAKINGPCGFDFGKGLDFGNPLSGPKKKGKKKKEKDIFDIF